MASSLAAERAAKNAPPVPREGSDAPAPEMRSDPADAVRLKGPASDVSLSLTQMPGVKEGQRLPNGDIFFDSDRGFAVVARRVESAVRVQVVMEGPVAPRDYAFRLKGRSAQVQPDGSVQILPRGAGPKAAAAQVAKPWAFDAAGKPVATRYAVQGDTIVQTVNPGPDAKYPIVADPTFGHTYLIPTMYLNKSETSRARNAGYVAWLCGAIPAPFSVLCAGNVAIVQKGARDAYNAGKCAKYLISPGVLAPQSYTGGNCK